MPMKLVVINTMLLVETVVMKMETMTLQLL